MHRSGFVALIGRPNVGKSTLLNALLGEKVSIISDRPQTTRNQIRAILTREDAQIIFIDTPGLHKPKHLLGAEMVRMAGSTLQEVDLVAFIVEANERPGQGDRYIADLLNASNSLLYLVLNKSDLAAPEQLARNRELYLELCRFKRSFALSALKLDNLEPFIQAAIELMPEGPRYYPPEMVTDQPEKVVAAEIIREKVIMLTRQEIPFSIAVVVEELKMRDNKNLLDIRAEIFVERKSQVGIIVGKGGVLIKEVGIKARQELEVLFGEQVFLDLRVKVKRDWRNRKDELRRLGYR